MLAEANQWPADVVDYFGGAMPLAFQFGHAAAFMAIRREDATPLAEIIAGPPIPRNAQRPVPPQPRRADAQMVSDERDWRYATDRACANPDRRLAPVPTPSRQIRDDGILAKRRAVALRRRDRDGRQHHRRPRRPHADADTTFGGFSRRLQLYRRR
jgi:hypothetical protein